MALLGFVRPAAALVVGGGGSKRTDCLVALDAPVNDPPTKPKNIECTDGDSSCDADGVVNGECTFEISLCANSTYDTADCSLAGVQSIAIDHSLDNGDPKFDTEFQAMLNRVGSDINPPTSTPDKCTNPTTIHVSIAGPLNGVCKRGKKLLKITTLSQLVSGHIYTDKDKVKMTCLPASNPCNATDIFDGTFERIQTQIFNKSCAVSGCHDSQSHTGNMVLEEGSAYGSLINVTPDNSAAQTADGGIWRRVLPSDPDHSLIVAKINGPPKTFGDRMPKDKPKLDQSLINVIELWIAAGAPDAGNGWVPGTDQ
ncbi:MAG TPA: hypothetical protein VGK30_09625 [Candidatus Binatia bacterium]